MIWCPLNCRNDVWCLNNDNISNWLNQFSAGHPSIAGSIQCRIIRHFLHIHLIQYNVLQSGNLKLSSNLKWNFLKFEIWNFFTDFRNSLQKFSRQGIWSISIANGFKRWKNGSEGMWLNGSTTLKNFMFPSSPLEFTKWLTGTSVTVLWWSCILWPKNLETGPRPVHQNRNNSIRTF
jgi:hypothetical protein